MKLKICIALLCISGILKAQITINEIMPCNVSAVWDDGYNYSMWVEIYNSSDHDINQSQYFLTDNPDEPQKWRLPNSTIQSGGFNLVWMEKPEMINHSTFKLDPEGGSLYLMAENGTVIDELSYPRQFRNISYGRVSELSENWIFFDEHTAGISNVKSSGSFARCTAPVLSESGGLFDTEISVSFQSPEPGDTIRYTFGGNEPTRNNSQVYIPGSQIRVTTNTVIRAKTYRYGKLSSDVVTASFLIGQRNFNLPVISLVLPSSYLYDTNVGIYVEGTNGITGCGDPFPHNWNREWDRPANFELFDRTKKQQLNQEVDIQTAGCFSRANNKQKSLHIQPKNKFGDNTLSYPIFTSRKNQKYKDIMIRNSGNDAKYSMMRDGMMQTLIIGRMDLEYLAYEPSVVFVNGEYFGIFNMRDRSNADLIYTTHGLDEEEIEMTKTYDIVNHPEYKELINFITVNDITQSSVFEQLQEMMDVENYQHYMMTHMFSANYDWPHNNIKMWKKKLGGKWRWILYDTDFGFNLFIDDLHTFNSLTYALGENKEKETKEWATALFSRLMQNQTFKDQFIDRYSVHLSSTFKMERIDYIIDSLAARIRPEIGFHKLRWESDRNFDTDIQRMKLFSKERPSKMLSFISKRLVNDAPVHTLFITSSIQNASYSFNSIPIPDNTIHLKSFKDRQFKLVSNDVPGYKFIGWEIIGQSTTESLIPWNSEWRYWDASSTPDANWHSLAYADSNWKSGNAQLGYGNKGETTLIGYGDDSNNKYITAYFRKSVNIEAVNSLKNASIELSVDDGAVVYVNGTEIGRYNMPTGEITFSTLALNSTNGEKSNFSVPVHILRNGTNVIAVEVHQNNQYSSDLAFNLEFKTENLGETQELISSQLLSGTITGDLNLKAIYEITNETDTVAEANILINEILASNSIFKDEWGDTDDYIELYNAGEKAVDLAGWYLTDEIGLPTQWQFPDTVSQLLEPRQHLLVWADDDQEQGPLHMNFKLSAEGEFVGLFALNKFGLLMLKDSVTFTKQTTNRSFSRMGDGAKSWMILDPTPLSPNLPTSLNDSYTSDIRIYPTVFNTEVTLESSVNSEFTVYDITGNKWYKGNKSTPVLKVDLTGLPKGVYFIKLGFHTFKVYKE